MKLREALRATIPQEDLDRVNTSFDVIGDIAVLEIDEDVEQHKHAIAQTLLELHNNIKVVVRKASEHEGELRIQTYEHLAGEDRTETVAKENSIRLFLDINKTYYSPRSQNERLRVINHVREGERVLIMFAGIGPFTIGIAKNTQAQEVIGVELNQDAHKYAQINIQKNKAYNAKAIHGDVEDVVPGLGSFDRVAMPLPHTAHEHLSLAANATKPGGVIHLYTFASEEEIEAFAKQLPGELKSYGRESTVKEYVQCGSYNPAVSRWCVDILLEN